MGTPPGGITEPPESGPPSIPRAVRLYRLALRMLPGRVRDADGKEILTTFRDLWQEEAGRFPRIRLAARAFGRLPLVAAVEWKDHLSGAGEPQHPRTPWRWGMSAWVRNLRYATRSLRQAPSFTFTVVVLIGLGVGAVTTIFTLVDHVVLRDLPYPAAERLFLVDQGSYSGPSVEAFQEMSSVEAWGITLQETANLVGEGDPLRVTQTEVSRDFFSLFGARPLHGRLLVEDDFQSPSVVVLDPGLWERAFGSDPDVVGKTIRVDGDPFTVVGVVSRDFVPPEAVFHRGERADLWLPMDWSREAFDNIGYHALEAVGRMAPGVSLPDVQVEMDRVLLRMAETYPEQFLDDEGNNTYEFPVAGLQEITTRPVRTGLGLLLGAVGVLLLVACLNVAHLFLARGLSRVQEVAVRRALGADTPSLVQQLLAESLVLGAAGGALGLGLAAMGLQSFLALNPNSLPRTTAVALDFRILFFAAAVSALTVLVFGLVPALRSFGKDLANDLRGVSRSSTGSRGTARLRSGLVVAEVALSLVLVVSAGLLLKSFMGVQARDPGFETAGVWTLPLSPSWISSPAEYVESMDRVEAALATVPGVSRATYSLTLPLEMTGRGRCCWSTSGLTIDGEVREGLRLFLQPITETYFETLGVDLLAGRVWRASEALIEPWPVVIGEVLAVELFGSAEAAMDRTLLVGGAETPVVVYGVATDTRHFGLDQDFTYFIYLPMENIPFDIPMAHMAVATTGDPPAGWSRMLRDAVWSAVPDMPVPTVRSMDEWVDRSTAGRRFDSALFGAFGGLALLLAAAGLYGTLLYSVGQRRKELGIRLALGAERRALEGQVVRNGLLLAVLGSVLGLAGTWGTGRFLESRLYDLQATDPITLLTAVGVLLVVAGLASWFPARSASRTDPLETLKAE